MIPGIILSEHFFVRVILLWSCRLSPALLLFKILNIFLWNVHIEIRFVVGTTTLCQLLQSI